MSPDSVGFQRITRSDDSLQITRTRTDDSGGILRTGTAQTEDLQAELRAFGLEKMAVVQVEGQEMASGATPKVLNQSPHKDF